MVLILPSSIQLILASPLQGYKFRDFPVSHNLLSYVYHLCFCQVKIPSWTPPAKVGTGSNSVSSKTPNTLGISPGTGMQYKLKILK